MKDIDPIIEAEITRQRLEIDAIAEGKLVEEKPKKSASKHIRPVREKKEMSGADKRWIAQTIIQLISLIGSIILFICLVKQVGI